MQELEALYEDVLARLPVEEDKRLPLNGAICGPPPEELVTANLKVSPLHLGKWYGDSQRVDLVQFFADKPTYQRLGLLLLANIFHPNRQVTLHLTHPESTATKIKIDCGVADPTDPGLIGLASVPQAFGYQAKSVAHMHPFWGERWRVYGRAGHLGSRLEDHLPFLELTNEDEMVNTPERFQTRDVLRGFGDAEATAALADLLLDVGSPQNKLTEIYLESVLGNWSMEIGSVEMRLYVGYDLNFN